MDRRMNYRIEGGQDVGLDAAILTSKGDCAPAEVLSLSEGGASLRFQQPTLPLLAIGDWATIRFEAQRLETIIEARACVCGRTEEEPARRYDFEFTHIEELQRRLARTPELRRLFNRRRIYRVMPDAAAPVRAMVGAAPLVPAQRARVEDISSSGARLSIPPDLERMLVQHVEISLEVLLPQGEDALSLRASVRHRMLEGDDLFYGVMFLDDDGQPLRCPAIDAYVMDRQRELLRRRRAR